MEPREFLFDGPEGAGSTLVLAHGAGAPMDSPFMDTVARGVAKAGIRVARFEFAYMKQRRHGGRRRAPDPQRVLLESWKAAFVALGRGPSVVIGGKSLGGRIASLVADGVGARGLVCLGYPFHPPGRPETLRTAHLEAIRTPTLILQGTRDPFGTPEEVEAYRLSSNIRLAWLDDGDHSFKPRVRSGRTEAQNLQEAIDRIVEFVRHLEPTGR